VAFPGPGPGRPKGSRKRRTREAEARLARLGCDPLAGMALIAMDEKVEVAIRAKMYAELARYLCPKRKAVEHRGQDGSPRFVILGACEGASAEAWERRVNGGREDKLR
jgi:hypothetical protein